MSFMKQVVIVGAGISGLALAYRLQQLCPSVDITILEESNRVGGKAWTERRDGFQVEIGPNGFLDNKPTTVQLCRDVGLADRLIAASEAARKNRYLFINNRLNLLPGGPVGLLKTPLLSWRGKLNFLAERFRPPRKDGADESIAEFARRRAGAEIADVFADALVTGIFAGDPALLSASACFPRMVAIERQYGSLLRGFPKSARERRAEAAARGEAVRRDTRMWSFPQGLRLLVETVRDRLAKPPILGVNVRRIAKSTSETGNPAWVVHGDGQDSWPADAVVLSSPAYHQASLLGDLDPELAERIGAIAYNRVAVAALGYRADDVPRPLDGFGYIAPQRLRRDVLGVQWCSSTFPERAPPGMVLLRAMCGGWHRPEIVSWDDDRLLVAVRAELQAALGVSAAPNFVQIVRWDRAIPQYHVGHLERVAEIEARAVSHAGLFLAGNAYHGVAVNDCTDQASVIADRVRAFLERDSRRPSHC